jgi:hypothetical protein
VLQEIKVVGSAKQLGDWDVDRAPMLNWTKNHWWRVEVDIPTGALMHTDETRSYTPDTGNVACSFQHETQ